LSALRRARGFRAAEPVAAVLQRALQADRPRPVGERALSRRRRWRKARRAAARQGL